MRLRRSSLWGAAAVAFLLPWTGVGRAAPEPAALAGEWVMTDETMLLSDVNNPTGFRISSVTAASNGWSDGHFSFAWAGDTAASRGYYSLETGRVWLTTRRYLKGRWQQVEYQGALREAGARLQWQGTATTKDRPPLVWSFVARRPE